MTESLLTTVVICQSILLIYFCCYGTIKPTKAERKRVEAKKQVDARYKMEGIFDAIRINMSHHFVELGVIDSEKNIACWQLIEWCKDPKVMERIEKQAPGLHCEMWEYYDLSKEVGIESKSLT